MLSAVLSNYLWVEASYRETQIGHLKVGNPILIDVCQRAPTNSCRATGWCTSPIWRPKRLIWLANPTEALWWISAAARASLVVPLRKHNNFLGVRIAPFALANRPGFAIGSARNRPARQLRAAHIQRPWRAWRWFLDRGLPH